VTPFDPPAQRWLSGHRGVDLDSTVGARVLAPAPGTVVFAGTVGGKPVISLDHTGGLRTTYEPVLAAVRRGDGVTAGAVLGTVTVPHPGCPVAVCLHWGALLGPGRESYVDPMSLLAADARPIRLKALLSGDHTA